MERSLLFFPSAPPGLPETPWTLDLGSGIAFRRPSGTVRMRRDPAGPVVNCEAVPERSVGRGGGPNRRRSPEGPGREGDDALAGRLLALEVGIARQSLFVGAQQVARLLDRH